MVGSCSAQRLKSRVRYSQATQGPRVPRARPQQTHRSGDKLELLAVVLHPTETPGSFVLTTVTSPTRGMWSVGEIRPAIIPVDSAGSVHRLPASLCQNHAHTRGTIQKELGCPNALREIFIAVSASMNCHLLRIYR